MTATDELRRLLDERGVEWFESVTRKGLTWIYRDGKAIRFHPWQPDTLKVSMFDLTPEQAVAATLGPLTEKVTEQVANDTDAGTCHDTQEDEERFCCSACGKKSYIVTQYREFDEYGTKTEGWIEFCTPHFCPNCGRKVVDA